MNQIPQDLIDRIRAAVNLPEWIGRDVPLKRSGSNWVGLCPFHQERRGSFNVSESKALYKCFGCGAGGNIFTWVMERENLNFPLAVRRVAKTVGIHVP